jgi:hypothetical protein
MLPAVVARSSNRLLKFSGVDTGRCAAHRAPRWGICGNGGVGHKRRGLVEG